MCCVNKYLVFIGIYDDPLQLIAVYDTLTAAKDRAESWYAPCPGGRYEIIEIRPDNTFETIEDSSTS